MLKLKVQYFGHLMRRVDSLEKTLMLGGIRGRRRRVDRRWDDWMASPTRWTWVWVNSRSWWWTGRPGVLWFMGSQRIGHNWENELNWTDTHIYSTMLMYMYIYILVCVYIYIQHCSCICVCVCVSALLNIWTSFIKSFSQFSGLEKTPLCVHAPVASVVSNSTWPYGL